jgi:hypothetical protein
VEARLRGTSYPHYVYWLLDTSRIAALANDVEAQLDRRDGAGAPAPARGMS